MRKAPRSRGPLCKLPSCRRHYPDETATATGDYANSAFIYAWYPGTVDYPAASTFDACQVTITSAGTCYGYYVDSSTLKNCNASISCVLGCWGYSLDSNSLANVCDATCVATADVSGSGIGVWGLRVVGASTLVDCTANVTARYSCEGIYCTYSTLVSCTATATSIYGAVTGIAGHYSTYTNCEGIATKQFTGWARDSFGFYSWNSVFNNCTGKGTSGTESGSYGWRYSAGFGLCTESVFTNCTGIAIGLDDPNRTYDYNSSQNAFGFYRCFGSTFENCTATASVVANACCYAACGFHRNNDSTPSSFQNCTTSAYQCANCTDQQGTCDSILCDI